MLKLTEPEKNSHIYAWPDSETFKCNNFGLNRAFKLLNSIYLLNNLKSSLIIIMNSDSIDITNGCGLSNEAHAKEEHGVCFS